jgi:hypothetical protein
MDPQRFDSIIKMAAPQPSPRRGALRLLAVALVATAGGGLTARGAAAGAGCFKRKKRCRSDTQCCTRNCRYGVCR